MLAAFVREHWRAYGAAAAMLTCIAALTVWIPRQVGHVVDDLVAGGLKGPALIEQLALLIAAGLVIYLLRVGWRLMLFKAAYRLGARLRTRLFARLALQGPAYFQQQRTGDLMALATNDIDAVEQAAGEAMLAGFDGTQTLLLVLAMMTLGIDWRLGLAALLPFPLMALAFWWISKHLHQAAQDSLNRFGDLNQQVQESLAGVRTLRALGLVGRSERRFSELASDAAEAAFRSQRWEAAYEPAVGMTLGAAVAIALAMGGWLVAQREISIGQLTAFTIYLGQLIWPMFAAGWVLALLERGRAAHRVGARERERPVRRRLVADRDRRARRRLGRDVDERLVRRVGELQVVDRPAEVVRRLVARDAEADAHGLALVRRAEVHRHGVERRVARALVHERAAARQGIPRAGEQRAAVAR